MTIFDRIKAEKDRFRKSLDERKRRIMVEENKKLTVEAKTRTKLAKISAQNIQLREQKAKQEAIIAKAHPSRIHQIGEKLKQLQKSSQDHRAKSGKTFQMEGSKGIEFGGSNSPFVHERKNNPFTHGGSKGISMEGSSLFKDKPTHHHPKKHRNIIIRL